MTKARTYNVSSGQKNAEGISQEPSFKSELISIQSPAAGESDILTEFVDGKEVTPKSYMPKKLYHKQSDEYDPYGMEEFNDENFNDQPIYIKFDKLGIFQEK